MNLFFVLSFAATLILSPWHDSCRAQTLLDPSFSDHHFRVVAVPNPPFVYYNPNQVGNAAFNGSVIDLLYAIIDRAGSNNSVSLYLSPDNSYGVVYPNGSATGAVKELIEGNADIIAADLTITSSRLTLIDFSTPFIRTNIGILKITQSTSTHGPLSFMDPFTPGLWSLIFSTALIFAVFTWLLDILSPYGFHRQFSPEEPSRDFSRLGSRIFTLFATISLKHPSPARNFAFRFMIVVFTFYCFIILSTYTAVLARIFATPPQEEPSSAAYLTLVYQNLTYAVIEDSSIYSFLEAQSRINPIFSRGIKLARIYPNSSACLAALRAGKVAAFALHLSDGEFLLNQPPHDTTLLNPGFGTHFLAFGLSKNLSLTENFNYLLTNISFDGTLAVIQQKWWITNSPIQQSSARRFYPVDIPQLAGLWYFILICGGISSLLLLFERLVYQQRDLRNRYRWFHLLLGGLGDRMYLEAGRRKDVAMKNLAFGTMDHSVRQSAEITKV